MVNSGLSRRRGGVALVIGLTTMVTLLIFLRWTTGGGLDLARLAPYATRPSMASDSTETLTVVEIDDEFIPLEENPSYSPVDTLRNEILLHPFTSIPNQAHVHGFTVIDNLYLRQGTFYILAPNASQVFPPRRELISRPVESRAGVDSDPTDQELQFLEPESHAAESILGSQRAMRVSGVSVVVYDPSQFMHHFYHWFGEIILGFWRVYTHTLLDSDVAQVDFGRLPPVERFLLPFISSDSEWRDRAGVDGPLMRAAFPNSLIETAAYWNDLKKLDTTVIFERTIIITRSAAHKHPFGGVWYKMIAGTMNVTAPEDFWRPIRENVWESMWGTRMAGVDGKRPVVTYISRQGGGRRLNGTDHEALVAALHELESSGHCDVQVVQMEKMILKDQVDVMRNSTANPCRGTWQWTNGMFIHQLWMQPSPRSTVIEIFAPEAYVFDYEMLARNMGHKHYAVWNDTYLTFEKGTYHKARRKLSERLPRQ
ncbi:hypothetical protein MIND_01352900 [Mycena indigotica]|uniref:Uncharacterized protein n=1 Tax=Mycena indigotica TaxID=2126181 RepID=A0A8H6VPY7_9AGAR|nr:uncharacterized protein MIND_01352900 [Mycena indigotica]KAF7289787.1 hypothetical protein MIND_01352900 [Mycena indigotica]